LIDLIFILEQITLKEVEYIRDHIEQIEFENKDIIIEAKTKPKNGTD